MTQFTIFSPALQHLPKCMHNVGPDKLREWTEKRGCEERERDMDIEIHPSR